VYGIAFTTYKNQTAAFGRIVTDPTLISQLWGITIYDKGPQYSIVGLAGTQQLGVGEAGPRIGSLQAIVMNLNCTNTVQILEP
jgi:hypothetical protein